MSTAFMGFNWVDLLIVIIIIYFSVVSHGFFETLFEIFSFVASLVAGYRFYGAAGALIVKQFQIPHGIANVMGFFLVWIIFESILYMAFSLLFAPYLRDIRNNPINKAVGYLAGAFHACLVILFVISMVFAFPVRAEVKHTILQSKFGPYFITLSQNTEQKVKDVFGGAVQETLNFLTVKPESGESIDLGVKVSAAELSYDPESETTMFTLINKERTARGIHPLIFDTQLQLLARNYAQEMFVHGFFSHVSQVDGSSPADRAERSGIQYMVIGENLAFAPDVTLAHQGLMNSEGHRRNILSPEYGKVGIGVVESSIYGRMFVQEFSN